jgi:hypothetical protein
MCVSTIWAQRYKKNPTYASVREFFLKIDDIFLRMLAGEGELQPEEIVDLAEFDGLK